MQWATDVAPYIFVVCPRPQDKQVALLGYGWYVPNSHDVQVSPDSFDPGPQSSVHKTNFHIRDGVQCSIRSCLVGN